MKTCPICGVEFEWHRSASRTYCSQRCAAKATKGRPHPGKRRPENLIVVTCIQCGKEVVVHKAQNRNGRRRRFCSIHCRAQWIKGSNNPMYIDGKWRQRGRDMYGKSWRRQRKLAERRDGKVCQICGKKQKPGQRLIVDIHHIVPYRLFNGDHDKANALSNLITLCKQCHNKVERHGLPCPQPLL